MEYKDRLSKIKLQITALEGSPKKMAAINLGDELDHQPSNYKRRVQI